MPCRLFRGGALIDNQYCTRLEFRGSRQFKFLGAVSTSYPDFTTDINAGPFRIERSAILRNEGPGGAGLFLGPGVTGAVVNTIAAGVHGWYLRKLIRRKDEVFRILHVRPESKYLLDFLDFYRDDIAKRYQPNFVYEPAPNSLAVFLLRDMVPAGLVVAKVYGDSSFEILLDYVIPQYRDFKLANWLYSEESGIFAEANCRCAWTRVTNPEQEAYFTKVGFKPDRTPEVPNRFAIDQRIIVHDQSAGNHIVFEFIQ